MSAETFEDYRNKLQSHASPLTCEALLCERCERRLATTVYSTTLNVCKRCSDRMDDEFDEDYS